VGATALNYCLARVTMETHR